MIVPATVGLTLTDWFGRALTVPGMLTTTGWLELCTRTTGKRSGAEDESPDTARVEDEALQADSMSNNRQLICRRNLGGIGVALNFAYCYCR